MKEVYHFWRRGKRISAKRLEANRYDIQVLCARIDYKGRLLIDVEVSD